MFYILAIEYAYFLQMWKTVLIWDVLKVDVMAVIAFFVQATGKYFFWHY